MKNQNFLNATKLLFFFLTFLFVQCSEEQLLTTSTTSDLSTTSVSTTSSTDGCLGCTYVVPANTLVIDGQELGLQPGSIIGLNSTIQYGRLIFRNIVGTAEKPIIIRNCGGTANINGTGFGYSIKTENSKYFKISGGSTPREYGIKITGGHMGITLEKLSSNFEVDHIEIQGVGFAGIMAKTDPTCDDATIRGNFTMMDVYLHHNYIHETGGEGMYIGNSFYENGVTTACGVRLPHEIQYLKIFDNIVKNAGWEGIQVGCATKAARVYNNTVVNYGQANVLYQNNGIQIGAGTGGLCYGNLIQNGPGNGLIVMGLGDNVVHDNVIMNAGENGIFCDERYTPGPGFKFINNTIISPKVDGIRIFAELVPMNVIVNNLIINPGSYSAYTYPRSSDDAFVYKLDSNVKLEMTGNYFTTSIDSVEFLNPSSLSFKVAATSPLVNQGTDISMYNIEFDFTRKTRLRGEAYDIGAVESY